MKPRTMTSAAVALALVLIAVVTTRSIGRVSAAEPQQGDRCAERLRTFDTLDFQIFSHQVWNRFSESHADNIIVTWPDGLETNGLTRHIADLSAMFVYAPNITIAVHPIRICQGDYTAVTGGHDRNVLSADADGERRGDPPDREVVPAQHGHHRPLDRQHHGSRVAVLGQPGLHAPDRTWTVSTAHGRDDS